MGQCVLSESFRVALFSFFYACSTFGVSSVAWTEIRTFWGPLCSVFISLFSRTKTLHGTQGGKTA